MGFGEQFGAKIQGMDDFVVLATVEAKHYRKANLEMIRRLVTKEKIPGVYVTLNVPFTNLQQEFRKEGVNADLMIFIDAITKTSGGKLEKTDRCLFIGNPENLSDISVAMDQAVRAVPGEKKFLFFDSLNTLLLYNSPPTVAKFVHFLSGKMRVWKVKGIIVSLEKESNRELVEELSQFCDLTFELRGGA